MSEMTERVKSPYDTGTGYIHRQCEEREDALRATIRGLEAENARLREALERILAATPEGREEHRLARKALKAPR